MGRDGERWGDVGRLPRHGETRPDAGTDPRLLQLAPCQTRSPHTHDSGALALQERHAKPSDSSAAQTAKVVSFIDLAGHERHVRTAVYEPFGNLLGTVP